MPTLKSIVATVEGEFVMYQVNREQVEGNEFWKRKVKKGVMGFLNPVHEDRLEESGIDGQLSLNQQDSNYLDEYKSLILRMNEYTELKKNEIEKLAASAIAGMMKKFMDHSRPNKIFKPWRIYADVIDEGVGLKNLSITVDQEEGGIIADFKVFILSKDERDLEYKMSEHLWADMFLNNKSPFYDQKLVEGVLEKETLQALKKACENNLKDHRGLRDFLKKVAAEMS